MTELGPIPSHGKATREHIVFIDFLRGSAALLVAAFHSQIHGVWRYPAVDIPIESLTYRFIYGRFGVGVFSVALFFMVSGFLIPSTLERPSASVTDFAIRRFFRLYPLYWLSIAAMAVISPLLFHTGPLPVKQLLLNLTMLQGFLGVPDVIGVYWTLQIEVVFYILCAILFATGLLKFHRSQVVMSIVAALACGAAKHALNKRLPVALFLALCLMFLGNLLRHASRERSSLRTYWTFTALVAAAVGLVCWLSYGERWRMYLLSYWAALAVFSATYLMRNLFESTRAIVLFCTFLGAITYGAYLFHPLVGIPVAEHLHWSGHVGSILRVSAALIATSAVAFLLYLVVEKPCIELGRQLSSKLARRKASATEVSVAPVGSVGRAD